MHSAVRQLGYMPPSSLRDDPFEGLSHLPTLRVSAVCRPRVDSLERHRIGDRGSRERIVLAVEIRSVLASRASPVRVDELGRHFLPLTRGFHLQTPWCRPARGPLTTVHSAPLTPTCIPDSARVRIESRANRWRPRL